MEKSIITPNICWLTCTHGRYTCLQRNIRCFLDQTYEGYALMFICNTGDFLKLDSSLTDQLDNIQSNRKIIIHNCGKDQFKSVGEKYNYCINELRFVHPGIDVACSSDDDDIFLPDHLGEGAKGILQSSSQEKLAYKPQLSYFRYRDGDFTKIAKNENTYETSIFVDFKYLCDLKFANVSIKYHQQWLDPLIRDNKILVSSQGKSTLVYNWGDNWDTYKMSGSGVDNQNNFEAHKRRSLDMGNGILKASEDNTKYYKEIENFENSLK